MGTNATIVIADRHEGEPPKVLAGLYAQFNGGVLHTGAALVQALDKVVFVPGDALHGLAPDRAPTTDEEKAQHAALLDWRAAHLTGIPVLLIARLFNAVDVVSPGEVWDMGSGPRKMPDWRYSHNAFLLELPDQIDLDNCIYRYFVEPRTPEHGYLIAGHRVRYPRPWIKAMHGADEVIFEGWPEDATAAFEAWHAHRFADD